MRPSTYLDIVNVGDGACSILDDRSHLLVLDCGSWYSQTGEREAHVLRSALGERVERLHALVVSHFDQDHWKGLHALADQLSKQSSQARDAVPDHVTLFYPGLSGSAEKLVTAFITVQGLFAGVRALDLYEAWAKVPTGTQVGPPAARTRISMEPRFRGDFIEVGAQRYEVLWPPRELGVDWNARATRTLEELDELAPHIPGLKGRLKRAYGEGRTWASHGQQEARDREGSGEAAREHGAELDRLDGDEDWPEVHRGGDEHGGIEITNWRLKSLDPDREAHLRELHDRLAELNNHLSLVIHSVGPEGEPDDPHHSWLLAQGDVQGWSLGRVAESMKRHYAVALAPHHGTVPVCSGYPQVDTCVLQNGPSHYARRSAHIAAHGCQPVNTRQVGSDARLHFELGCRQRSHLMHCWC